MPGYGHRKDKKTKKPNQTNKQKTKQTSKKSQLPKVKSKAKLTKKLIPVKTENLNIRVSVDSVGMFSKDSLMKRLLKNSVESKKILVAVVLNLCCKIRKEGKFPNSFFFEVHIILIPQT